MVEERWPLLLSHGSQRVQKGFGGVGKRSSAAVSKTQHAAHVQLVNLYADEIAGFKFARYRQVIGDQPTSLAPVKPIVTPIPKTLPEAVTISLVEHPAITAILDGVDAAQLQIKIAEGALYPQASITASASNNYDVNITPGQKAMAHAML